MGFWGFFLLFYKLQGGRQNKRMRQKVWKDTHAESYFSWRNNTCPQILLDTLNLKAHRTMGFSKLKSKESRKLPDEDSKKEILVQNKMRHRMTDGPVPIRRAVLLTDVLSWTHLGWGRPLRSLSPTMHDSSPATPTTKPRLQAPHIWWVLTLGIPVSPAVM